MESIMEKSFKEGLSQITDALEKWGIGGFTTKHQAYGHVMAAVRNLNPDDEETFREHLIEIGKVCVIGVGSFTRNFIPLFKSIHPLEKQKDLEGLINYLEDNGTFQNWFQHQQKDKQDHITIAKELLKTALTSYRKALEK